MLQVYWNQSTDHWHILKMQTAISGIWTINLVIFIITPRVNVPIAYKAIKKWLSIMGKILHPINKLNVYATPHLLCKPKKKKKPFLPSTKTPLPHRQQTSMFSPGTNTFIWLRLIFIHSEKLKLSDLHMNLMMESTMADLKRKSSSHPL